MEKDQVKDGMVLMPIEEFIEEHERLLKVLKEGPEYEDQKNELAEVKAIIAEQEGKKKVKKNASEMPMDELKAKMPEAKPYTFQGNLNAY